MKRQQGAPAPESPSRAFLDLIIKTAPDAIITIDAQGTILTFSPAGERIFGYLEGEIVGQNVSVLMPSETADRHDGYLARYLRTGERRIIGIGRTVTARRKNGDHFAAELAVGELDNLDGTIFTGFIRDVSDRLEAERRARRLQMTLEQVSRRQTVGEVSTALAHEINQPLTAIANFAHTAGRILDGAAPDTAEARALLGQVEGEAKRAGEIVRRMRRLIDRGTVDLRSENINNIIVEAVRLSESGIPHEPVHVIYDLDEGLPSVLADRIQIQQVIVNLMKNAADAVYGRPDHDIHIETRRGQAPASVVVTATRHDPETIQVTISDEGPGIPEGILNDIFEPFHSTSARGLGVGLAICRSIIRAHNGRIWAENRPDGGASVHFTLPAAQT